MEEGKMVARFEVAPDYSAATRILTASTSNSPLVVFTQFHCPGTLLHDAAVRPDHLHPLLQRPRPPNHLNGVEQCRIHRAQHPHLRDDAGELQLRTHHARTLAPVGVVCDLEDFRHGARGGHLFEMSTSTSVPRRMRAVIPENGYESPGINDEVFFGKKQKGGERRRVNFSGSSVGSELVEREDADGQNTNEERMADQQLNDEEKKPKTGVRDRVGCFTWTWFTMTMATGGIANVLHSSNEAHISRSSVLT